MGQLDLPETNTQDPASPIPTTTTATTTTITPTMTESDKLNDIITTTNITKSGTVAMETVAMDTAITPSNEILSISSHQPLFTNILSQTTGPSPEYLQSLLNVNEALLAQSLANNGNNSTSTAVYQPSTPMLTPVEEHREILLDTKLNSPMITPQQEDDNDSPLDENVNNTPQYYMGTMNPESEMILSPLTTNEKSLQTSTTSSTEKSIYYQ